MVMEGFYDYMNGFLVRRGKEAFVGMVNETGDEIPAWPANVYNVNDEPIGTATSKEEFMEIWNSDAANQAVGRISGWYGPFIFILTMADELVAPEYLGLGGFNNDDAFSWIDSDGSPVLDSDDSKILLQ
jgi:hypothetical protein